ncbi:chromosome partitioning protein ParA family ATPase [Patulibacter medicamentivorans]|uniref:Chromosome partitioning protein ParA family ATPase n=1 Tax=Patulibacter medicamentivorans TaxID=1097667 RepID=H0E5F1_9ACTN|nr:AAA family ATPase [Patulibacter medicamentivorans]EHN11094.1 chromosome partitioning protein ParA family ATPase [Patulibacter medicamentivorans]
MTRVIAVANQKGGAGKSTVTVNLAVALGQAGRSTLVVDIDPQFDSTAMFGLSPESATGTIADVFLGESEAGEALMTSVTENVDLLVGDGRMADVELTLVSQVRREEFLAEALREVQGDYDLVLIDCPPNLGLLTVNGFLAADEVLVPISMVDRNAYKGAATLLSTLQTLRRRRVSVETLGLLRNNVDERRNTYQTLNEALPALDAPLLDAQIPMRAGFHDATTEGIPLVVRKPDGRAAQAFRELAAEIQARSATHTTTLAEAA